MSKQYRVLRNKNSGNVRGIEVNGKITMTAELVSYQDYLDDKDDNECHYYLGRFTTIKKNRFVLWYDTEYREHFIAAIEKKNNGGGLKNGIHSK